MNRLVEGGEVPVIWIVNDAKRLGSTVLRRMDMAIAFPNPGPIQRQAIARRILDRRRLKLGEDAVARIAALEAAPAVIDRAVRVAKLVKGDVTEVEAAASSVMKVLGNGLMTKADPGPLIFDPTLSMADVDLDSLAQRVVDAGRSGRHDLSFCLYGMSGTGKSAFARHLASRMGLEVLEKRASDLLGPFVGETEAEIADTFREAEARRAMLIFDEADSLLRDRAGALRSWEVTQVNEMLTWMERHPYPFVCTTNLMDSLDPATLRRFVFKVRFLPMTPDLAAAAFTRSFGQPAPAGLHLLDPLTPGDFTLVARKAAVLGETDPQALLAFLRAEVDAKPGAARQPIGFLSRGVAA